MANEKRLIDADKARESAAIDLVVHHIDRQPTVDAVEVVRCRDCKHFTEGMAIGMCKRVPDKPILPIPYNHYCSYGERRDGGNADG